MRTHFTASTRPATARRASTKSIRYKKPVDLVQVAKRYCVRLIDYSIKPDHPAFTQNDPSAYINRSTSSGCPGASPPAEIILGRYSNENRRIASFFHELGHIIMTDSPATLLGVERRAWEIGFQEAVKQGFSILPSTKKWALSQLRTYHNYR